MSPGIINHGSWDFGDGTKATGAMPTVGLVFHNTTGSPQKGHVVLTVSAMDSYPIR